MANETFTFEQMNAVYLERQHKWIVPESPDLSIDNRQMVLTMMKNVEDLGFLFSQSLFEALRHQKEDTLLAFYQEIVPVLKKMVGANVPHKPFYVNFPQQMMQMTDLEIYMNAICHYWTLGAWKPEYEPQLRFPLLDQQPQIRLIELGTEEDFDRMFSQMMQAKGSLAEHDRDLLKWYIQAAGSERFFANLPEVIPAKETLGLIAGCVLKFYPGQKDRMKGYFKTATDVLRLAVALSEGDVSLAQSPRFAKYPRAQRKFLLELLETAGNIEEDMLRYAGYWIRLGEKLHPGEYSQTYPKANEAFQKIRNGVKIPTFNSRVQGAFDQKDGKTALELLKQRGGELARKLDYLMRSYPESADEIICTFAEVSADISSQVLLQVMAHFKDRIHEREYRSFFPKGNLAKVMVIENTLEALSEEDCGRLVQVCEDALVQKFSDKPPLGKVYINPALKDIVVPLAQRAASKNIKSYARGSRFSLSPSANTVRAFIHWRNVANELTDVDLSVVLLDDGWIFREQISYTNIRSDQFKGLYHSGDVRDAPKGASEFIDLDLNVLRNGGVRYVLFNVYSYSRQGFNQIPECFFGWMERERPASGEIFEPKTVVDKADLTAETTICMPVLLDLVQNQVVWIDLPLKMNPNWYNNVHGNLNNVTLVARAFDETVKPNLYDVMRLNALARGELVDNPAEADLRVGLGAEDDVTPFAVEKILTEFL